MKIQLFDRVCFGIGILMFTALTWDRNSNAGYDLSSIQNHDQFKVNSQIITIQDKSGDNKLTLRLHCKNSDLLTEYVSSEWQLITMINQDSGIEPIIVNNDYTTSISNQPIAKIQIELVKIEIQNNVVGYYIEKKFNPENLNKQYKNKYIETEFISPYESFGGYLQIASADLNNSNSIQFIAETLDDPMVEPKIGIVELIEEHQYLSIGFSDLRGVLHSWKVKVRHGLSTFPIVYWINTEKQINQFP